MEKIISSFNALFLGFVLFCSTCRWGALHVVCYCPQFVAKIQIATINKGQSCSLK